MAVFSFARRYNLAFHLTVLFAFANSISLGQSSGGVQGTQPTFRVVRSVSGSKGSQQAGRYHIEDPRSTFYMPDDKQVIVYWEWDGPLGKHHMEGYWKNPEGKATVISEFDFENKDKRFGAYWTLNLTDGTVPGIWSLEARVDGEITGTHSFQIVVAAKPNTTSVPAPQILAPSEIYKRALAATVNIDNLLRSGDKASWASGFFIGDGLILTAFEVIDGASSVNVHLADGRQVATDQVVLWNRWQDWAILKIPSQVDAKLNRAMVNSWAVGDRCFYLNVAADGTRSIVDLNITGSNKYPNAGERLSTGFGSSINAVGSPLFNENGDVIGIVAGNTIPGTSSLFNSRFGIFSSILRSKSSLSSALIVPMTLIPDPTPSSSTSSFADLLQQQQFVTPLTQASLVGQGSLAMRLDSRPGYTPMPLEEKYEFTKRDQQCVVFVMWAPKEKRNTTSNIRLYDLNNSLLSEGKPSKLNLRPSEISYSSWQVPVGRLSPGTYRIDIMVADQPAWRTFFSVGD